MKGELANQEGEMLVSHLIKCLDPEATCELRVDQISVEKVMTKMGLEGLGKIGATRNLRHSRHFDYQQEDFSPIKNQLNIDGMTRPNQGSKSEFQFPVANHKYGALGNWDDRKSKKSRDDQISYQPRDRSPGNFKRANNAASTIDRHLPEFGMDPISRDRLI